MIGPNIAKAALRLATQAALRRPWVWCFSYRAIDRIIGWERRLANASDEDLPKGIR